MHAIEAIKTRRSIRKYTDAPVSEELIREILEAAMLAPSAGNQQPWQFVVVDDREILDSLPSIHPYLSMVRQAPVGILVCGDQSKEKYPGYWVQDCSAAVQNLLLAAHALGLGAVWTGIHPMEDRVAAFRERFNLPDEVIPLAFIPLGHPAQEVKSESRYREDRVHSNTY
ncbi:nitroreductase family protein [Pseudodesulfovibrio cashew]|uniref:Nitroreductase family protein n=1 Tax=Pseudodesulfovibrio cashew TaxID=2678688 RepID=A0A6I6JDX6_9BACT|nr:nitroreductase family protein [Pseudodesulfovibrio cashew]QGY39218.1 nitroreductase family protein [Pseudodesulfovibrio cashew]